MKQRRPEPVPDERQETIRQSMISVLENDTLSAKDLSAEVGISEKAVYEHLEHIQRSAGKFFRVVPAECKKCGFVFAKREKLKKPGKCPVCRGESIREPLFSVRKKL